MWLIGNVVIPALVGYALGRYGMARILSRIRGQQRELVEAKELDRWFSDPPRACEDHSGSTI